MPVTERDTKRERERAIKENCLKRILKVNAGPPISWVKN